MFFCILSYYYVHWHMTQRLARLLQQNAVEVREVTAKQTNKQTKNNHA